MAKVKTPEMERQKLINNGLVINDKKAKEIKDKCKPKVEKPVEPKKTI